ncbi:hypothetical protein, partial [Trinickia caryophylli]|uniref:hypothetical protein n=1 Tax=Trinickia caryophylli TaxID=28094 RepID=UPI0018EB04EB
MNLEMSIAAQFEFETEFEAQMIREIPFAAQFEFQTEVESLMIREIPFAAQFEFKTEFEAGVKYYHIDMIEFTGDFAPGERIVID